MSKSATKAPRAGIGRGGNRGISTILLARPDSIGAFVADLDTDRVRLVPRDPCDPSVSGSASRRPSRGRTWRPGRIVPGRTRLRGRQNRAIMRKPTDTPGAVARTILPGRQNRVWAPGPARPRPRRGAPVQQIRTHPAPQAPYAPLRHTQNNLPGCGAARRGRAVHHLGEDGLESRWSARARPDGRARPRTGIRTVGPAHQRAHPVIHRSCVFRRSRVSFPPVSRAFSAGFGEEGEREGRSGEDGPHP